MTTQTASLANTDTAQAPAYGEGPLSRWCKSALYDARDEVFVRLTLRMLVLIPLSMCALYAALRFAPVPWWAVAAAYIAMWGWFTPPVILMLHNTMHRPFIRRPKFLDRAHPLVMSLLFGIPTGYREHHVGMHHVEDNMPEDLSSTMRYRRDSFLHFLVYFLRFFFLSIVELPAYLIRRRRHAMARRALTGEFVHQAVIVAAVVLDWHFAAAAFVFPYVACRFMMMAGNWGQHAFVNADRKNNGLANSATCINTNYNRRCFNDGYHIGHHMKANRHWAEMPGDFEANREAYAREGALVFEGIDFFMISLFLWTGRWNLLARHFVRLDGKPRSDEEVIAMLKQRVHPIRSWPAESIGMPAY